MKQKQLRSMIINAIASLLCAAVWHGAALAAEPDKKRDMYYSGEREFCMRLLNNADKAEKIEPVLGPTLNIDIDEGELYAPKTGFTLSSRPCPSLSYTSWSKSGNG